MAPAEQTVTAGTTPTTSTGEASATDMSTDLSTDHSRAVPDGAHYHGRGGTPKSSRAARATSFDLADFPVPTGREEEWRFAPVARLEPLFDTAGTGLSGTATQVTVVNAPEVLDRKSVV